MRLVLGLLKGLGLEPEPRRAPRVLLDRLETVLPLLELAEQVLRRGAENDDGKARELVADLAYVRFRLLWRRDEELAKKGGRE